MWCLRSDVFGLQFITSCGDSAWSEIKHSGEKICCRVDRRVNVVAQRHLWVAGLLSTSEGQIQGCLVGFCPRRLRISLLSKRLAGRISSWNVQCGEEQTKNYSTSITNRLNVTPWFTGHALHKTLTVASVNISHLLPKQVLHFSIAGFAEQHRAFISAAALDIRNLYPSMRLTFLRVDYVGLGFESKNVCKFKSFYLYTG